MNHADMTKQASRTPGPWSDSGMTGEEGCVYSNGDVLVAECSNPEDVQIIVRACNAHDDLVAALRKAIKVIEYCAVQPRMLHPMNNAQHVHASNSLDELRAALQRAES